MLRVLLLGILASLLLSGCASNDPSRPPPETDWASFTDANDQTTGAVGGSDQSTKRVVLERGVTNFVVKARYAVGGSASFELYDPEGTLVKRSAPSGGAATQDERWFEAASPRAGTWRLEIDAAGGVTYGFGFYWEQTGEAAPQGPATPGAGGDATQAARTVAFATAGFVLLAAAAAFSTEVGRYKLLAAAAGLGLFSRLEREEVLAHEKREQVYHYIKSNPGPSFSDLRRDLELSNGTLVHHLRVLESQEYVKAYRDGFRTRFYLRGPKIVPTAYLTRTQQHLLDTIASNPGVTQKELSRLLGLPRESVSYHAKRLAAQGQLQVRQEGKWRRYWAVGGAAAGSG